MTIIPTARGGPSGGLFDTIGGLPVHPLIIHVVAVLLPLSALALIAIVMVPRWRSASRWLVLTGLTISAIAALVARQSGQALADRVGVPVNHAELGNILPAVAFALLIVATAWAWLSRPDRHDAGSPRRHPSALTGATAVASVGLALGAITMTVVVGHSGAKAVWSSRVAVNEPSASAAPHAGSIPPGTAERSSRYTLAEVARHASGSDCWSAIDGTVYDLTTWIGQHPGGAGVIEALCGSDGSAAFTAAHSTPGEPAQVLSGFALGTVR